MYSIVGSFSEEKLIELCKASQFSSPCSHSLSYYDVKGQYFFSLRRSLGSINYDDIKIEKGFYCVVHHQTCEWKNINSVQPADKGSHILWNNGSLTWDEVERLQKKLEIGSYNHYFKWDTYLLLLDMIKEGYPKNIQGSLAGLYCNEYKKDLILFRNQHSTMYFDKDLNISSRHFDGAEAIEPDILLKIDFKKKKLIEGHPFKTMENVNV